MYTANLKMVQHNTPKAFLFHNFKIQQGMYFGYIIMHNTNEKMVDIKIPVMWSGWTFRTLIALKAGTTTEWVDEMNFDTWKFIYDETTLDEDNLPFFVYEELN